MSEPRVYPLCVVRTEDQAIKFYEKHDPILAPSKTTPLQLNLNHAGEAGAKWAGRVCLCKRCGVLYVDAHGVEYAETPKGIVGPVGTA